MFNVLSSVAHVLFTLLFVFVCEQWCQAYIVLSYFVFLRLVYHMLPVSPNCQILIAPSVFSKVYLYRMMRNTVCAFVSFFGSLCCLFILDLRLASGCPFSIFKIIFSIELTIVLTFANIYCIEYIILFIFVRLWKFWEIIEDWG
jgi:hypothetical protein